MLDHENRVRDEFTRQAETFSASAAITDTALTQRFITALGEAIRGSVLDVACGPGILSAAMAKAARDVVAFDLTPQMLKKAGRRCSEAGLGNVTFREGNAAELPFADAAFDAAVTRLSVTISTGQSGDRGNIPRPAAWRQLCNCRRYSVRRYRLKRNCRTRSKSCATPPMCGCCRAPS